MSLLSETPRPGAGPSDLRGLEGWLALVGLGLCLTPFMLLKTIIDNMAVFEDETWTALTVPGSPTYHPLWQPLLIGEAMFNVLLLAGSVVALWLFFRKRRAFPRVAIALLLASAVVSVGELFLTHAMLGVEADAASVRATMRAGFGAVIWIPYFIESKRVRATFVE